MDHDRPANYFLVTLVAITAIVVLNGIAYRSLLYPVFAAGSDKTGLSYEAICTYPRGMDDEQFQTYVRQFEGKQIVNWKGWVRWGPPQQGNLYQLGIALEMPGDLTWGQDIELLAVPASVSNQFRWGQQVVFSGTIRQVSIWDGLCQISIEDVIIMPSQ
jgi:hypothetical protein